MATASIVQYVNSNSTAVAAATNQTSSALGSTPTIGNLIVIVLQMGTVSGNTPSTVTTTPTGYTSSINGASAFACSYHVYYKTVTSGDTGAVTFKFTNSFSYTTTWNIDCFEFANANNTSPIDVSIYHSDPVSSPTAYAYSTVTPNALPFMFYTAATASGSTSTAGWSVYEAAHTVGTYSFEVMQSTAIATPGANSMSLVSATGLNEAAVLLAIKAAPPYAYARALNEPIRSYSYTPAVRQHVLSTGTRTLTTTNANIVSTALAVAPTNTNNYMVAFVNITASTKTLTVTTPTGWTSIGATSVATFNYSQVYFRKVVSADTGSLTIPVKNSATTSTVGYNIECYEVTNLSGIFQYVGQATAAATMNCTITPAVAGSLQLAAFTDDGAGTITTPSGYSFLESSTQSGGGVPAVTEYYIGPGGSGTTSTTVAFASSARTKPVAQLVICQPLVTVLPNDVLTATNIPGGINIVQSGPQTWALSSTTNGLTLTPTLSSTPASPSLVALFVHNDAGSLTGSSIPTPSGWTAGPTHTDSTGTIITAIFYCFGLTVPSVTITLNATGGTYYGTAALIEYSGVDSTTPTMASNDTDASLSSAPTTLTGASATPTTSGGMAVSVWGWNDNSDDTASTTQSGWTSDVKLTIGGLNASVYASLDISHLNNPTSGTALTPTLAVDGTSYISPTFENIIWLLNPAGGGGGGPTTYTVALSDTQTASDSIAKVGTYARTETDTSTFSDGLVSAKTLPRGLADTSGFSDSIARAYNAVRPLSDTQAFSDVLARIIGFARTASDSETFSDSMSRVIGFNRLPSDAETFSDGIGRLVSYTRTEADTSSLSDSIKRVLTDNRSLADTSTFTDSISATKTSGAVTLTRSLSDTSSLSDSLGRVLSAPRSLSDTSAFSDVLTRLATYSRTEADTSTFSDSLARVGLHPRALSDSQTFTDALARLVHYARSEADTSALTDAIVRTITRTRGLTDTSTLTDSAARVVAYLRTEADTSTHTDSLARIGEHVAALVDTVITSDVLARLTNYARSETDTSTFSDSMSTGGNKVANLTETFTTSDALARVEHAVRALADSHTASDALVRAYRTPRSLSDTHTASDSLTRVGSHPRALTDTFTTSDSLQGLRVKTAALADTFLTSDSIAAVRGYHKSLADVQTFSDVVHGVLSMVRGVADTSTFSDVIARVRVLGRQMADVLSTSDSLAEARALHQNLFDTFQTTDALVHQRELVRQASSMFTTLDELVYFLISQPPTLSIFGLDLKTTLPITGLFKQSVVNLSLDLSKTVVLDELFLSQTLNMAGVSKPTTSLSLNGLHLKRMEP